MPFDFGKLAETLDRASPTVSNRLTMTVLGLISPFNSHLKARLVEWKRQSVEISMTRHRQIKNHVGSIHAGALFTLGETCAGLLVVKNFSFKEYRPLMTEISVKFEKQARGFVKGRAELTKASLDSLKKKLEQGTPQLLPLETILKDDKDQLIALVKTKWQIKPWSQVRKK